MRAIDNLSNFHVVFLFPRCLTSNTYHTVLRTWSQSSYLFPTYNVFTLIHYITLFDLSTSDVESVCTGGHMIKLCAKFYRNQTKRQRSY